MVTKIEDVIVPELFSNYVIRKTTEKSNIFTSGMAVVNPKLNDLILGGGKQITLPAWKPLSGDSEVLSDTTPLTAGKIQSEAQVAPVLYRGKAWGVNDLASALAGDNASEAIGNQVAEYWILQQQKILIEVLKGTFAAVSMSDLVAGTTEAYYDGNLLIDAQGKLGDNAGKLDTIIMHSMVRNDLLKKDKTAFTTYRDENVEFEKYLGYKVVVNDSCPMESGAYVSYLTAPGSVSLGMGKPNGMLMTETDRDSLAGTDYLINRLAMVIQANGMKWKGTPVGATASNTELANGTNWERVVTAKDMGIVKVVAKVGTAVSA